MMRFSARALIMGAIIVTGGGYVAYRTLFAPKVAEYETVAVVRGDVTEEVSETGRVVPAKEIDLFFKNSGKVSVVLVKEGDEVRAGAPLMKLDTRELSIKEREARAALDQAAAKYEQALAGTSAEEVRIYETAVLNAGNDLANTRVSAAVKLANAYDSAKVSAKSGLAAAMTALSDMDVILGIDDKTANDAFEDKLGQFDGQTKVDAQAAYGSARDSVRAIAGIVDPLGATALAGDVDVALSGVRAALGQVVTALGLTRAMLDATFTGPSFTVTELSAKKTAMNADRTSVIASLNGVEASAQNIASAKAANESEIAAAEGALRSADDALAAKKAPLRVVDKAVYESAVAVASAGLDLVRDQISDTTLLAPVDGTISAVGFDAGERVSPSSRAVAMISSALEIEVDVSELDIRKIGVGSALSATFDAIGTQVFAGKAVEIAAREKLRDEDIFYNVTVRLDQADARLKPGMTADIVFAVGAKRDVLVVPERQVFKREGRSYVRVLRGGAAAEAEVIIGLRGRDAVEIIDGLQEGDRIIVNAQ